MSLAKSSLCVLLLLSLVLLALSTCGRESLILINLDPSSFPNDTKGIRVRSQLGNWTGVESIVPGGQHRIAVFLPEDASGHVEIELEALNSGNCITGRATFSGWLKGYHFQDQTVALRINPLSHEECSVTESDFPERVKLTDLPHIYWMIDGLGSNAVLDLGTGQYPG